MPEVKEKKVKAPPKPKKPKDEFKKGTVIYLNQAFFQHKSHIGIIQCYGLHPYFKLTVRMVHPSNEINLLVGRMTSKKNFWIERKYASLKAELSFNPHRLTRIFN